VPTPTRQRGVPPKAVQATVGTIPTNKPSQAHRHEDRVYPNKPSAQKSHGSSTRSWIAPTRRAAGSVGTTSVEEVDRPRERFLKTPGLRHAVLQREAAREGRKEAFVVAQAGRKGEITPFSTTWRSRHEIIRRHPRVLAQLESRRSKAKTSSRRRRSSTRCLQYEGAPASPMSDEWGPARSAS